ncbi:FxsA family protein [Nocardia implantans]|uniref:FxsA family protein n=1 Tax=Nocardia implantans TaxID=3108168 RepID=A0ABU6AV28_9NOCA|nr:MULTISPECIES: FxsA family protein [unclassified Nocardia]MBF6192453.1 FxsA family protein [Nocardia beijingensis]MEA3527642.1 FxsA family protein [Nocardia sp. CDC192]MEB3511350.1 FxsA family protein [Nocardia sp. CDC186]
MPALLFVLYLVVEVTALVAVGQLIGALPAVLLLIAGSGAGMLLVGAQGRRVFEQFRRAARGEVAPGTAVADGAMVAAGGVLMFVPGLVTSLFGLLLLLPPTRLLARPVLAAFAARRFRRLVAAAPYRGVVVDGGDVVDGVVVGQWYDDGQGNARRPLTSS